MLHCVSDSGWRPAGNVRQCEKETAVAAEPITEETVLVVLLAWAPEFAAVYWREVEGWGDAPVLSYPVIEAFADHAQALAAQWEASRTPPDAPDILRRLLTGVEQALVSDDVSASSLMGAGFLEALQLSGPGLETLVALMGPSTLETWRSIT